MCARLAAAVAAVVIVALVAACDEAIAPSGSAGPSPDSFVNVPWSAISIRGLAPVPGSEPSIVFAVAHVKGSGGCNQFRGDYRYDQATGTIELANLAMTAMGCLDPKVSSVETAFAQALTQANRLDLDADGRLRLTGTGGEVVFAKMVEG
jgi:heat shock protein HslJ